MTFPRKFHVLIAAAVTAAAIFLGIHAYRNHSGTPAWTFAFYLDGSGSLLLEQQRNLREIIQGSREIRNANVVVYLDRGPAPNAPMFHGWNGARVFHVSGTYKEILSRPVRTGLPRSVEAPRFTGLLLKGLAPEDARLFERHYAFEKRRYALGGKGLEPGQERAMLAALSKSGYLFDPDAPADTVGPRNMSRFFSMVRDNFPARHYAFFIAGHGLGWSSGQTPKPSAEAAAIGNPNKSFHADAIKKGLAHNEPDILCLDLCLMADLESLYQLRHSADYLIMGEGPIAAGGQNYGYLFERILNDRASRPDAMARSIFASSSRALDKSRLNSAISLFRTGPEIDAFITGFTGMLSNAGPQRIAELRNQTAARLPRWGGLAHETIDLKSFIAEVQANTGVKGPDTADFLLETHSTREKATGLSIYSPRDAGNFQRNREEYAGLDFTRATGGSWMKLLGGD